MTEPIIVLASSSDAITMTGTDIASGFIYNDETMSAWLTLAEVEVDLNKRPNAHGTYLPDQLFAGAARIPMSGSYFGSSTLDAVTARNRLGAMFNDGRPVSVTVTDDLGATSRIGFIVAYVPKWKPDGHFEWQLEFVAPDPRRYGALESPSTGLATVGSGLEWPLGIDDADDLFWDWGSIGTTGRVTFTNNGTTTTYPTLLVGGGGDFAIGFEITEVQTGRAITYPVATAAGVVRLDNRTQRATINGGDVTGNLTRREWFAVPRGASYEYQLVTLGGVTGAPTMQFLGADAYL